MAEIRPWEPIVIEELTGRPVREVCELLLSFPSCLQPRAPNFCRAAIALFPNYQFHDPGAVMPWLWSGCWRVLDTIGLWLLAGGLNDGHFGLTDSDWQYLRSYPTAVFAACMNGLFPSARRVLAVMAGPEDFHLEPQRLREVRPFSLPSRRMARYIERSTGLDLETLTLLTDVIAKSEVAYEPGLFPRIAMFRG